MLKNMKTKSYKNICVFAGTTEGRRLIEYLAASDVNITACVATEYGEVLIEKHDTVTIHTGRLDLPQMIELFREHRFDVLIDATHPYAAAVTDNIIGAAKSCETEYLRLRRDSSETSYGRYFDTLADALQYLADTDGNILLTTGSKELHEFCAINNYAERIYPRVLPLDSSLEICKKCGYKPSHIIAVQGPFAEDINVAMIKMYDIKYMVTKESGIVGGFDEKMNAARKSGIELVVIGRPPQVDGFAYGEIIAKLAITPKKKVTVIGAGVGSADLLTMSAYKMLKNCDIIIGAKRVAESCNIFGKPHENIFLSDDIVKFIENDTFYTNYAVVMSGDVGFYSGAKKLAEKLNVDVICGISSPIYFAARIGIAWEDIKLCSMHAVDCNFIHHVKTNRRTFLLTGGKYNTAYIIDKLKKYGMTDVKIYIGERLSYADERITIGTADELIGKTYDDLTSVIIENPRYSKSVAYGIGDDEFERTEKVPMTKSEIRALSVAKLRLNTDSIVYDIGAGTGSVTVEIANHAYDGKVYAIEKKHESVELIEQNILKFGADNIVIAEGIAPEILTDLPPPTHAFIGGTSGNMAEIIDVLLAKNPNVQMVINAITLETVSETLQCIKNHSFTDAEIVNVSVAKSKTIGGYNMMTGQNPVYIISLR